MSYRISIAILGAGLAAIALPIQAQEGDREAVQARVKLHDLNLNHPAGQRTARDRIDSAARSLCAESGTRGVAASTDRERCRNEVRTSGATWVAQVRSEQLAAEQQRVAAEQQRLAAERASYQRVTRKRSVSRRVAGPRYRHCTWPKRYAYKKRVCIWRRR